MFKYLWLHIAFIFFAVGFYSQNEVLQNNHILAYPYESSLYKNHKNQNFHSGVKPYISREIEQIDSNYTSLLFNNKESKMNNLNVTPFVDLRGRQQLSEDTRLNYGAGVFLNSSFKKFGFSGIYSYASMPRFQFQDSSVFMNDAVNGMGIDNGTQNVHYAEFYFNWSPNKFFDITTGNGKHFWGDGYRSMMISDNAAPYPFLRIMSNFWNVKYTNLYAMHTDTYATGNLQRKFAVSHQLSWNIVPNLNFSIFESVVFIGNDTLAQRGFDVNYLNPIIFYRPVEYAIGSSDNVLMGASMKYVFKEKYVFYSQFVLDEFLLKEYRENTGWWANKYAMQVGFKTYDILNIKNLSFQTEVNWVRPFTYSHKTSLLNYAHLGQSFAHPMGANFHETVTRVRYLFKDWYFEAKIIYADRGEDFNSVSQGGNMMLDYTLRDRERGHKIGQGESHYIWYNEIKVSRKLVSKYNLNAFASYALRTDKTTSGTSTLHLFQIGLNSNLWNVYEDY